MAGKCQDLQLHLFLHLPRVWVPQLFLFLFFFINLICQGIPRQWNCSRLEVLRWISVLTNMIPHMLLFPGAQQVFQALKSHPLPRANSPWNQGFVFALAIWLVGSAPALIAYHRAWEPKSGGSAQTWSPSRVPNIAGNFPRESLLPFSSCKADPRRNCPQAACVPWGFWAVFGSCWGSGARAQLVPHSSGAM